MDLRSFLQIKTKPKTEPVEKHSEEELDEAYRQGHKDALEDYDTILRLVWMNGEFAPTLNDLARGGPTMSIANKDGDMLWRYPTKEEEEKVIWEGKDFRFPIEWNWGEEKYMTFRACLTGDKWTLREFLKRARLVYTAQRGKHLKAMGDHVFFEGFTKDGTFYCGS